MGGSFQSLGHGTFDHHSTLPPPHRQTLGTCRKGKAQRGGGILSCLSVCAAASFMEGWALQGEQRKSWLDPDSLQVCVASGRPLALSGPPLVCWETNTAKMCFSQWFALRRTLESLVF